MDTPKMDGDGGRYDDDCAYGPIGLRSGIIVDLKREELLKNARGLK